MAAAAIPTKAHLRARSLAGRVAMTPDEREVAAAAITRTVLGLAEVVAARTVSAYLSFGTEPATGDLVETLRSRGVRVLVPVLRKDLDLDWAEYVGVTRIAQGPNGWREPDGPRLGVEAIAATEVVVVPALAVDASGMRLGRGGGSYDRALARVPHSALVVALVYGDERPVRVPAQPHDRPVTAVVTPHGVRRFA